MNLEAARFTIKQSVIGSDKTGAAVTWIRQAKEFDKAALLNELLNKDEKSLSTVELYVLFILSGGVVQPSPRTSQLELGELDKLLRGTISTTFEAALMSRLEAFIFPHVIEYSAQSVLDFQALLKIGALEILNALDNQSQVPLGAWPDLFQIDNDVHGMQITLLQQGDVILFKKHELLLLKFGQMGVFGLKTQGKLLHKLSSLKFALI